MEKAFLEYFRCPNQLVSFATERDLSVEAGYFTFGDAACYGRSCVQSPSRYANGSVPDVSGCVGYDSRQLRLPFDFSEVVDNLRQERYHQESHHYVDTLTASRPSRALYYLLRPLLPVAVRKHLQKIRLSGWDTIPIPKMAG